MAIGVSLNCLAQKKMKPEETEVWSPVPPVVTPGTTNAQPPSDALILFDGRDLSKWESVNKPGSQAHRAAQCQAAQVAGPQVRHIAHPPVDVRFRLQPAAHLLQGVHADEAQQVRQVQVAMHLGGELGILQAQQFHTATHGPAG